MRHRMNSYNEISYRYVKAPLEFYVPLHFRQQDKVNKQSSFGSLENPEIRERYIASIKASAQTYERLIELGVCREQARGLLPVCTYSEFIFTCNFAFFAPFYKIAHTCWRAVRN